MKSKHEPWCHCWERKPKRETKVQLQPPLQHRDVCLCSQARGHRPETAPSSAEQHGAQRPRGRGFTFSLSLSDGSTPPQCHPLPPAHRSPLAAHSPAGPMAGTALGSAGSGAGSRGAWQRHQAQKESLQRGEEPNPSPVSRHSAASHEQHRLGRDLRDTAAAVPRSAW